MKIALVIAGGMGKRTGQDIPKQFINVNDKPVLIYTLEAFQKHPQIDAIEVVCLEGWHDILQAYSKQYNISKLRWVVSGGHTCQESIYNGIEALNGQCDKNDIVIIHDGIRPMIDDEVLSDVIITCQKYGNGISSLPYNEQIFKKTSEVSTSEYIPRDTLRRVQTPQAYLFGNLLLAYRKAFKENIGIGPSSYTNTMMVDLGEVLYFAKGSDKNIKITTSDDFELFKALLMIKKSDWMK